MATAPSYWLTWGFHELFAQAGLELLVLPDLSLPIFLSFSFYLSFSFPSFFFL
jgi:hypothetical protein